MITCLTVSDSPLSDHEAGRQSKAAFHTVKDEHGGHNPAFIAIEPHPSIATTANSDCSSGKSSSHSTHQLNAASSNSKSNLNLSSSAGGGSLGRRRGAAALATSNTTPPDLIRDTLETSQGTTTDAGTATGTGKVHHHHHHHHHHHNSMCNLPKQEAGTTTAAGSSSSRPMRRGQSLTPPKADIKFPPLLVDVTPVPAIINPSTHSKFQQISPTDNNNSWPCSNRSRPSMLNLNELQATTPSSHHHSSSGSTVPTAAATLHSHHQINSHHQQAQQHSSHHPHPSLAGLSSHKARPAPLNLGVSRPGVSLQQHSPTSLTAHGQPPPPPHQTAQPVYLNTLSTLNTLNTLNTINSFNSTAVPDNYRYVA